MVNPLLIHTMKHALKNFLLYSAKMQHVHIIGCSRSGTTMLHYAMCAFKNTILYDRETSVWGQPGLKDSLRFLKENSMKAEMSFFITKRSAGWWQTPMLEQTISYIKKYQIFLINIIRDPRDVLTSKHPYEAKKFYVEPWLWQYSIDAADFLFESLADYRKKLTIRYEDVVLNPARIETLFEEAIGLERHPAVSGWDRLQENVEKIGAPAHMLPYMHKLRNFDPSSIGNWRNDPYKSEYVAHLLHESKYKDPLQQFMEKYDYNDVHRGKHNRFALTL